MLDALLVHVVYDDRLYDKVEYLLTLTLVLQRWIEEDMNMLTEYDVAWVKSDQCCMDDRVGYGP